VPSGRHGPVGLHDRLQHRLNLLSADRVQLEPAADAAIGVPGDAEAAALSGVGLGAVRVEQGEVVVHHSAQVRVLTGGGGLGQHEVDLGQVHALFGGRSLPLGAHHRRDHGHLLGSDLPVGKGRLHRR
jgi:hypothetical protein